MLWRGAGSFAAVLSFTLSFSCAGPNSPVANNEASPSVLVEKDDLRTVELSGRGISPDCEAKDVAQLLLDVMDAFEDQRYEHLAELFVPEPRFQWFSFALASGENVTIGRRDSFALDLSEVAPSRHEIELLSVSVIRNGADQVDAAMSLERTGGGFKSGITPAKAAIDCSQRALKLLSIGEQL